MYRKYTIEGFLVKIIPTGERDIYADIFTKEFGLIRAVAKSARDTKSKVKISLETLSFGYVTLIRGKDVWRLVEFEKNISLKKESVAYIAKVANLIVRLIQGEGNHGDFYERMKQVYFFLNDNNQCEGASIEIFLVSELLRDLGYWKKPKTSLNLIENFAYIGTNKKEIIKDINISLKATHL